MKLRMKIDYSDGSPAASVPVEVICEDGPTLKNKTDQDGRVELTVDSKFIYRIAVSGQTVRSDWWVGDSGDADESYEIEKPGTGRSVGGDEKVERELKGRLFYSDGTAAAESFLIEIEFPGKSIRVSEYSNADGRFKIKAPYEYHQHRRDREPMNIYVRGQLIDKSRINYSKPGHMVIVLPQMLGRKAGDGGGLITGQVVDSIGDPYEGAKVSAQVVASSLFGGLLSGGTCETRSNQGGYFALEFDGGTEIKNLIVDGNDPLKVSRKRKDGTLADIVADRHKAGSFGLILVRRKKLLGIW